MYDLLVKNARIYPMHWDNGMASARTLAVTSGRIAALGVPESAPATQVFDAADRVLLPGFVDCHTHALYAGDRMAEHAMRLQGASYEQLARAGGGIQTTVQAVRAASEQQLLAETLPRIQALQSEGVTTVEIKSGYGLDLENELKMLRAIRLLRVKLNMDIVPTFLGAHAVPNGRTHEAYLAEVIENMLPVVAREKLADNVDIFAENFAFSVEDLRLLFMRAASLGFKLRAHTDQLSNIGATSEAATHGALCCDHLEYATEEDILAMKQAGAVAVLLPGACYFLRENRRPPVAMLRRHQVPMAVASDMNPGSSPIVSLLAIMHMSTVIFGLTPAETLLGVTRNAAKALGRSDKIGSLVPGLHADFCIWDISTPEFLTYQLGGLKPDVVFFKGNKL